VTLIAVLAVPFAGLSAGAPLALASATQVVSDCNAHGKLTQPYTVSQLKTALSTMPADVKEYTNCYDVIQRALLSQIGGSHAGGGGSSGSGGSFLSTPVIVIVVVLLLAAATLGSIAVRRRRSA
jgi:hypothetical protein